MRSVSTGKRHIKERLSVGLCLPIQDADSSRARMYVKRCGTMTTTQRTITALILRAACVTVAACALFVAVASTALAETQYWVTGRGWGHGIGMSQYGAKGFAQHGYTGNQIISYYYHGASVGPAPAGNGYVNVRLSAGTTTRSFSVDAAGASVIKTGGGTYGLVSGDVVKVKVESGLTVVYRTRSGVTAKLYGGDTALTTLTGPAGSLRPLFTADNGASNTHYRGTLRVHNVSGKLTVVNNVGIEQYLWGVVPSEMPSSWPASALHAQAIAARSYAIATKKSGIFDQYADTRSQMYLGIEHEAANSTAAVNATTGQAAIAGGVVIPTFFFSTSGGRTAAIEDVWGSAPRSYLKSVPDPYEASPYTAWPEIKVYTRGQFANILGSSVKGSLKNVSLAVNPSRRVDDVTVIGSAGNGTISGSTFQYRFGLRSTWFRVIKLSIASPRSSVRKGATVKLFGSAPRSGATYLMFKNKGDTTWQLARRLKVGTGGTWASLVRVKQTRVYRLKRAGKLGPKAAIRVR